MRRAVNSSWGNMTAVAWIVGKGMTRTTSRLGTSAGVSRTAGKSCPGREALGAVCGAVNGLGSSHSNHLPGWLHTMGRRLLDEGSAFHEISHEKHMGRGPCQEFPKDPGHIL